ncbi:NAD(P)H-hydrate epimerase [Nitrosopumilus ureiphilus]|uniref:NAD(P)H-hydrate epimerase n=2 Tax=Nitrosopumilus ureiphilus TaxID=1470067 RepID=A0A7D5M8C3_9ARCH|nr:NAD(P)H-hydrate epimerase [Nitrosopumilus ureiphilus]
MKKIDQNAVTYGMPIELMMENAGREICNEMLKKIKKYKIKKILVVAGNGNNGGGVIAASRHLSIYGISLKLVILGTKNSLSTPSKLHLSLIRKNPKIQIIYSSKNLKKVLSEIQNSELIIDGIFGIGINRDVIDPHYSIISAINDSNAYVISNDVPSGINADSGKIYNIAVKPNYLVVLHKPKKWMMRPKTLKFIVANIGIPIEIDN